MYDVNSNLVTVKIFRLVQYVDMDLIKKNVNVELLSFLVNTLETTTLTILLMFTCSLN